DCTPRLHSVASQHACQERPPPRKALEDLGWRKRKVEAESDPHSRHHGSDHGRHELELVVVDPDQVVFGGDVDHGVGEPLVHLQVGTPPVAMKLRWPDGVVVQRPDRSVAKAVVVVVELARIEWDGEVVDAVGLEALDLAAGGTCPTDPDPAPFTQDGRERRYQSSRTGRPAFLLLAPTYGKTVGGDNETGRCRAH